MINRKKIILYIITKSVWGGAGKYVYDLATNLPQTKFRAMVAAGPADGGASGQGELARKLIAAGIPYFEIESFQHDINIFKEIFAYFEILLLLLKIKPDIIHVNSSKAGGIVGVASFTYSLLIAARYSLLKIFTAHGWAFHENRPKWQIFLIKLFSRITCFFYSKIICVSEFDRLSAIKNNIAPTRKLITVHNGIKPEDYVFLERTENKFTIGTIGEAVKNKGHEYLKAVQKYFPDVNFNIITNLPGAAGYLKNLDIFVLPSLKEGLPYTLLEAGLAELPIIATNVGGIPEIIGLDEGLLVEPANAGQLANAIGELIKNPEKRKLMAANLRQKILREFSLEKMLKATLAAYEENRNARK